MGGNPWTADAEKAMQDQRTKLGEVKLAEENAKLRAEVDKAKARPQYPGYTSILDDNGSLRNNYSLKAQPTVTMGSNLGELDTRMNGIQLNKDGLNAIRSRALSSGMSPWASLMMDRQRMEESGNVDRAAGEQAGAEASARSNLAMRGGLSSGARERLARYGARDMMKAKSDIYNRGASDRLGIQVQDENQKLDLLKGLPGMELQSLDPEFKKLNSWQSLAQEEQGRKLNLDMSNRDYNTNVAKYNIDNALGEKKSGELAKLKDYEEQMKAWAANRQAEATENAGK